MLCLLHLLTAVNPQSNQQPRTHALPVAGHETGSDSEDEAAEGSTSVGSSSPGGMRLARRSDEVLSQGAALNKSEGGGRLQLLLLLLQTTLPQTTLQTTCVSRAGRPRCDGIVVVIHSVAFKQRASRGGHQLRGLRLSAVLLNFTVMPDCWCTLWPAFNPLAAPTGHQFDAALLRLLSIPGPPCGGQRGGQHWGSS